MVDPALKEQLLTDLELLTPGQQKQAAEYVHALRLTGDGDPLPPPADPKDLQSLIGILDDESAREMMDAVAECKQVDLRDW